ncbi:hypothetical protein PV08_09174 [Exophiala spinifera]|uniref:Alpha-1,3-mannosyltransferase n=1 Tax=Exophiala spinifera TaxID=91928 RepID=A0A0D1YAD4_9EURO|nr:uncharacterized protein PV08_09174 [Exophiala spinifera]KIW11901.1 hypothetical protein PV08_09174 [Exophiala spinifera]
MFTPKQHPLKEGRSFPGLPDAGPSRRTLKHRQTAIIILVLICVPLIYFFSSTGSEPSIQSGPRTPADKLRAYTSDPEVVLSPNPDAARQQPNVPGADPVAEYPANRPKQDAPPFKAPPAEEELQPAAPADPRPPVQNARMQPQANYADDEEPADEEPLQPAKRPTTSKQKPSTAESNQFSERPKFEKALTRVISLMPGEMEGRDLLRPVEGTGKEKLREMGLRAREYKKFFQAWEDLHLAFDEEGGSYVRDDVIQYLRHHVHQPTSEDPADSGIAQMIHTYEAYRYFLVKFGQLLFPWTAPYFPDHMALHSHFRKGGRGLVLTAGDDQAPYLLTTIPIFRKLGCDLPIEVMYLGDSDLSEDYRADLEALEGVVTRDIAQMVNDEGWKLAGWAAKPFAILFSSFREVIFIDADSLFMKNPEVLFDDPSYRKTGALFFRDRLIMPESKKRWLQQILPKPISRQVKQSRFWTGDSGHMQESGVIVVDKWKHFIALLLVTRMNGPDRDGNKDEGRVGVYDMVYGDKETFWLGWELVGDQDYTFHQGDAGTMGVVQPPKETEEKKDRPKKIVKTKKKEIKLDGDGNEHEEEIEVEEEVEDDSAPEVETDPETYTICSPQLLHLDLEGNPLWFNGWLQDNKFADKKKRKFGKFEHYLIEPRDIREPGAWQLEESNMCCLTTDAPLKKDFTQAEKDLLNMMIQQARDVGMSG